MNRINSFNETGKKEGLESVDKEKLANLIAARRYTACELGARADEISWPATWES